MPFHFRWPGGHRATLEPEEEEPEASEVAQPDDEEDPPKAAKAKPKATPTKKAKANPKTRPAKTVPVSEGGRSVMTEYYGHRTLNDMPAGSWIVQKHCKKHFQKQFLWVGLDY